MPPLLITPYLRYYGGLVQEEWPYLKDYLPQFKRVHARLENGQFEIESKRRSMFLFFLTLRKPVAGPARERGGHTHTAASEWGSIHREDASWRKQLIGEISDAFVVPRYVKLFYDTFGAGRDQEFFEVGSGQGDLCTAILRENRGEIRRYVASDYFAESVTWLRAKGLEAVQADAQALPCADAAFDAVIDFDVMHHVARPRDMAREMMRAGPRARAVRRVERPQHPAAAARAHARAPRGRREELHAGAVPQLFRGSPGLSRHRVPHLSVPVPVQMPALVLARAGAVQPVIEKVPVARWQCSSVVITVAYERTAP